MTSSDRVSRDNWLEYKQLELENQLIQLEREKLVIERFKAQWTGISILIPLLAIAATIGFNVWSQDQQAKSNFEIQAAEIVLNATGPSAASAKAKALQDLFPDRLPSDFAASFRTPAYTARPDPKPSILQSKKALLQLLVEHIEHKQAIIEMWLALFPEDKWANQLK